MAAKKKNPKFGGKRELKDVDKSGKVDFGDTFLGDLLGFDKDGMGLQGRAGLLKSLKGARRKKPNLVQVPSTTKKKPAVKKKTKIPEGRGINMTVPKKKAKIPEGRGINVTVPGKGRRFSPENKERLVKKMKTITLDAWEALTVEQRVARGLPKNDREVMSLTGAFQKNARKFNNAFKANRGGLAKKKPVAKMNKGGMAKKSGYMYGGSVTKKKPMNKGGMARKK